MQHTSVGDRIISHHQSSRRRHTRGHDSRLIGATTAAHLVGNRKSPVPVGTNTQAPSVIVLLLRQLQMKLWFNGLAILRSPSTNQHLLHATWSVVTVTWTRYGSSKLCQSHAAHVWQTQNYFKNLVFVISFRGLEGAGTNGVRDIPHTSTWHGKTWWIPWNSVCSKAHV